MREKVIKILLVLSVFLVALFFTPGLVFAHQELNDVIFLYEDGSAVLEAASPLDSSELQLSALSAVLLDADTRSNGYAGA